MKKTLFFILMILVLMVSSCNLFLKEEYGELILSFDGSLPDGARALDLNGLPSLSSSPMKIDIIRNDGYTVTRELGAEEPKSLVELVPVGEKIKIIVTAINPSGQWSGRAFHTVTSGQNHVRVLLNKNISGLKNLLFTQKKTDDPSTPYNLTLYMNGKEINAPQSQSEYSFARDSLGRPYVRYKPNDTYLARYTSEGELDGPLNNHTTIEFLANDYTTGTMYGLSGSAINKIEENLTLTSPFPTSPSVSATFAVDNGIFTWADLASGKIHLWKAGMGSAVQVSFSAQVTEYKLGTNDGFAIKDIFIRNGYVYVLFAGVQSNISHGLYSLGAVLKWKIGTDPASANPRFEGTPVVLGKSAGSPVIKDGVLKNYDYSKNFYGAVKVIGFDEENIYIADDGFDAAYVDYGPHIVKNRNRIAALNMETNTVSFMDEYTAKWYNEWSEWRGLDTKIVVWGENQTYSGFDYYQLDSAGDNLSSEKKFATVYSANKYFTDVFCFDEAGNIYIVESDNAIPYICRFKLKDDGSYDTTSDRCQVVSLPVAIAVNISGAVNALYYSYDDGNKSCIKRLTWAKDAAFSAHAVQVDTGFAVGGILEGPYDGINIKTRFTALAADKNGFYVAVKTLKNEETESENYTIEVKKYAHDTTGTDSGRVSVTGETTTHWKDPLGSTANDANKYVHESLNALYVVDGSLYGLTTKRIGVIIRTGGDHLPPNKSVITGKLLKIGDTAAFPVNGDAVRLDNTPDLNSVDDANAAAVSGKFAPYRFIAVKPKKLVIASDGYYAPSNNEAQMVQKNKGYIYDLKSKTLNGGVDAHIEFSKKITSSFEW